MRVWGNNKEGEKRMQASPVEAAATKQCIIRSLFPCHYHMGKCQSSSHYSCNDVLLSSLSMAADVL